MLSNIAPTRGSQFAEQSLFSFFAGILRVFCFCLERTAFTVKLACYLVKSARKVTPFRQKFNPIITLYNSASYGVTIVVMINFLARPVATGNQLADCHTYGLFGITGDYGKLLNRWVDTS
jgi:hypothetical protein